MFNELFYLAVLGQIERSVVHGRTFGVPFDTKLMLEKWHMSGRRTFIDWWFELLVHRDIESSVTLAEHLAMTENQKITSLSNLNLLLILIKAYLTLINVWSITIGESIMVGKLCAWVSE